MLHIDRVICYKMNVEYDCTLFSRFHFKFSCYYCRDIYTFFINIKNCIFRLQKKNTENHEGGGGERLVSKGVLITAPPVLK